MAIQLLAGPAGSHSAAGPMNLPPSFDKEKFAAKWVKEGPDVQAAAEREWILGTNLTADGWEVWKDAQGRPHKVALRSGTYIVLHRSAVVQKDVNAIYGNIGKERLMQEKSGQTTGGVPTTDPGLLSDDRIAKVTGVREDLGEGDVKLNPVGPVERQQIKSPVLQTSIRSRLTRRS